MSCSLSYSDVITFGLSLFLFDGYGIEEVTDMYLPFSN
jgi:hypothetical protein